MDFQLDTRTEELRAELLDFMDTHVYPAESVFVEQLDILEDRWAWESTPIIQTCAPRRANAACGTCSSREPRVQD